MVCGHCKNAFNWPPFSKKLDTHNISYRDIPICSAKCDEAYEAEREEHQSNDSYASRHWRMQ